MWILIPALVLAVSGSKLFAKHNESLMGLPFVDQFFSDSTLTKTMTYEQELDSWTHSFKDRTPNDFEVESKNEAVFVLPASPSYESFLLFKKKHTHFIIQIAFEYKQQEQLDGEGVELTVVDVTTRGQVHSSVFVYIKNVMLELPPGPYLITFRNRDSFDKILKFKMGEEKEDAKPGEDIKRMSELAEDVEAERKHIHSLLVHNAADLVESNKHLEIHKKNQSRQYRNTIVQLIVIVAVNVAQLVVLRKLLEVKSII